MQLSAFLRGPRNPRPFTLPPNAAKTGRNGKLRTTTPPAVRIYPLATSHRRSRTRNPPLLLGRDYNHHDQRQNAEKQTEDAPAEWVAALGRCDQRAHDRRDNAADRDENSLDATQNETCGLRLAVAGQQQLM